VSPPLGEMLERQDLSGRGEASHRDAGERPPLGEMLERRGVGHGPLASG